MSTQQLNTAHAIDINSLCERASYLSSLNDFLEEKNPIRALAYWLNTFSKTNEIKDAEDIHAEINRALSDIDHLINDQLNCLIHHPRFKQLEASWRGVWHLTTQIEGVKNIKIKLLDVSWPELVKDISRAIDFDQSQLFQKVYNEEYGSPGGEPYGALIGDYEINHRPSEKYPHDDVATLRGISQIAAAAFAPFIAGASSELFGLDEFAALGKPLNLSTIFSQLEYTGWRALREHIDSRFIGLTVPRILIRLPYRTQPGSFKGLFFYEKTTHSAEEHYLWGNACYAFASILLREFANIGWFGHIRGVPRNELGGGLLTSLPADSFKTDAHGISHKPITDVVITDKLERELGEHGFVPLCQCYDLPFAAFYSNQSIRATLKSENKEAEVNSKLAGMLQHVLCASRVAHYIKVMIRDKVGSFVTAEECEDHLRRWLFKYTTGREDLEWEEQARYPLREAEVQVREHPDRPGCFSCVIRLVPHYQLDQMVSELELITELVQKA